MAWRGQNAARRVWGSISCTLPVAAFHVARARGSRGGWKWSILGQVWVAEVLVFNSETLQDDIIRNLPIFVSILHTPTQEGI